MAEARKLLGEPIWEGYHDEEAGEYRSLWYADPGAKWSFGDYRSPDTGFECVVTFVAGALHHASMVDIAKQVSCYCDASMCNPSWFDLCFPKALANIVPGAV